MNPSSSSALKNAYDALFEEGLQQQQQMGPPKDKRKEHDLWNCERKPANHSEQHLKNIPLGDKEAQEWIKSRKMDQHLDLDFLPRGLVYNHHDNIADSNKMIEKVLREMEQQNEAIAYSFEEKNQSQT